MTKGYDMDIDVLSLPESKPRALAVGSMYYFTGKKCKNGHKSVRYAISANCVQCVADKRGKEKITSKGKPRVSAENISRAAAALSIGHTTYIAENECKRGHRHRYCTTHNCVECDRLSQDRWKDEKKWRRIKKEYGLSRDDFNNLVNEQNGMCAICGTDLADANAHIDHCHGTGVVRGILCGRCNQALGLFKDSISSLKSAIAYLGGNSHED